MVLRSIELNFSVRCHVATVKVRAMMLMASVAHVKTDGVGRNAIRLSAQTIAVVVFALRPTFVAVPSCTRE